MDERAETERWGVISDCHGNADALAAVLAELDRIGVTGILNLGDHASGPLAAADTLDMIMARTDMHVIRGNHDRYLLDDPATLQPSDSAARQQLSEPHMDWLAGLPAQLQLGDFFLCHGTPDSDETYWLQEVTAAGAVVQRGGAAVAAFAGQAPKAAVYLCGHTHLPAVVELPSGALVVNPGSVGLPGYDDSHPVPHVVQSGDPAARFAILEKAPSTPSGWHVSLHRIAYDARRMVALADAAGRADWTYPLQTGWFDRFDTPSPTSPDHPTNSDQAGLKPA